MRIGRQTRLKRDVLGEQVYHDNKWWKVTDAHHGWLVLTKADKLSLKEVVEAFLGSLTKKKNVRSREVF